MTTVQQNTVDYPIDFPEFYGGYRLATEVADRHVFEAGELGVPGRRGAFKLGFDKGTTDREANNVRLLIPGSEPREWPPYAEVSDFMEPVPQPWGRKNFLGPNLTDHTATRLYNRFVSEARQIMKGVEA